MINVNDEMMKLFQRQRLTFRFIELTGKRGPAKYFSVDLGKKLDMGKIS